MSLTRAIAALVLAGVTASVLALAISATGQESEPEAQAISVVWAERPDSVVELEQSATSIVEAEVTAVADGPPLPGDDSTDPIPSQRISFTNVSVLEGPDPGATFNLFKTGSDTQYLQNDPPYAVGERYLLFVDPYTGEPGTYVPSSPDGRIRLNPDDEAHLFIGGPVKSELEGESADAIEAQVAE